MFNLYQTLKAARFLTYVLLFQKYPYLSKVTAYIYIVLIPSFLYLTTITPYSSAISFYVPDFRFGIFVGPVRPAFPNFLVFLAVIFHPVFSHF